MKKLLLLLLASTLPAFAGNTCVFAPQAIYSGHGVSCSLPILTANQCVEYRFHFSLSGSTPSASVNVKLNTSTAYPAVSFSDPGNYELTGRFCVDAGQVTEFYFDSPAFEYNSGSSAVSFLEGNTSGTLTEDVSVASTLTFNFSAGRGYSVGLDGGTVEIK